MNVTGAEPPQGTDAPVTGRNPRVGVIMVIWGLLALNTLGSQGAKTLLPIPRPLWQMITMGALGVAFVLALALNSRVQIRPSAFLLLLTLLLIISVGSSLRMESGTGAIIRCIRLSIFVVTLWLLSRWWDDAMMFVRSHIRVLATVLATVAAGLVVAPGIAIDPNGRLVGALWPLTPAQVGQYSAVVIGLTILLWLGRLTDRRSVAILVLPSIVLLLLSHARTATIGLLSGLTVAVISLVMTSARARRVFTRAALVGGLAALTLGPVLEAWFRRGQDKENLANLTGRAKVWEALLAAPRTTTEYLFGVGLTDKSFNGLPIDSSWLAVYRDQGLVGVVLVTAFMTTLVAVAVLRPPSIARACALFLITYCLVASYTEAGLGDASPYLLNLMLAAILLIGFRSPGVAESRPSQRVT